MTNQDRIRILTEALEIYAAEEKRTGGIIRNPKCKTAIQAITIGGPEIWLYPAREALSQVSPTPKDGEGAMESRRKSCQSHNGHHPECTACFEADMEINKPREWYALVIDPDEIQLFDTIEAAQKYKSGGDEIILLREVIGEGE